MEWGGSKERTVLKRCAVPVHGVTRNEYFFFPRVILHSFTWVTEIKSINCWNLEWILSLSLSLSLQSCTQLRISGTVGLDTDLLRLSLHGSKYASDGYPVLAYYCALRRVYEFLEMKSGKRRASRRFGASF
jgi:hypothetical protein